MTTEPHRGRHPLLEPLVALLGVATIAAYGSTYYAFGVLLEPIHDDTGWSRTGLGSAYSVSLLLGALGAALGGTVVDRWGGRRALALAALGGAPLLAAAAHAHHPLAFIAAWGLGAGIVAAFATYHVTLAVLAHTRGGADPRAYAALTFLGGLASPLYLPLVAALVESHGWRTAQLTLAGTLGAALAATAALLPRPDATRTPATATNRRVVADAWRTPGIRPLIVGIALASMAGSALNAYQVPALQSAGFSLAAASSLVAVRGAISLPGRALLGPVVTRTGAQPALRGAYLAMAAGTLLLAGAALAGAAPLYVVVTGVVFGSLLPLQALVAAEVFDPSRLGTLMGAQQALNGTAAAAGPLLAGLTVDAAGSFVPLALGVSASYVVAVVLTGATRQRTSPTDPNRPATTCRNDRSTARSAT